VYIIGIDLGTTNSAIAYVDSRSPHLAIQQFKPLQLTAIGRTDMLPTLASCCYLSGAHEWPIGSTDLPWRIDADYFVGASAKEQGAKVPTRLVQSAKSWLCHSAANRREKILPFEAADADRRISPIDASARYLNHIREAWNHQVAKGNVDLEFEQQEIVLTVPASFDEIARALTVEAAHLSGLRHLTLLEEPQAAFYAWLSRHEKSWQEKLPIGSCVLVCDVGGGTTDFSLIDVTGDSEKHQLQRMAVGNHLLLGGDNMDAAIAHYLEAKLFDHEPTSQEWMQLRHLARQAKEALLTESDPKASFQVILQGGGSSVVGGSRSATLHRQELVSLLMEGFFSIHEWNEANQLAQGSGIRAMGLPYEEEASICKHLAAFLKSSGGRDGLPRQPDFVLFNGGAMKPKLFQQSIVDSLKKWFPDKTPKLLQSDNLDLAVARGAAYYGMARRGLGVKVSGGSARGFYLGIDVEQKGRIVNKALTLLPRGSEEGAKFEPSHTFLLQPNKPAVFQLYTSHVRLEDASGDLIDIDESELNPLPPIHTILRFGKRQPSDSSQERIPVHLSIDLNAIGTLELWLKSLQSDHRWKLEFQLRSASGQENSLSLPTAGQIDEQLESSYIENAKQHLRQQFSKEASHKPERLMNSLEEILEQPRNEWSLSLLRVLWEALPKIVSARQISAISQARWWNLAGFLLRPGFGFPLDDFRLKELWLIILSEINTITDSDCLVQKAICYRRVAPGLNKGQQMQIAHTLLPLLWNKKTNRLDIKGKSELNLYNEVIRAFASLELIDAALKIKVGEELLKKIISGKGTSSEFWSLGRIGARQLFHGSITNVINKDLCSEWIEKLLLLSNEYDAKLPVTLGLLAHKTDHREINISPTLIDKILKRYPMEKLGNALTHCAVSTAQREEMFGEQLPVGLLLKN
jgi:molecular chaperone DnaK (HSP70)